MLLLDDDGRADGNGVGVFFYGGDYNLPSCMTSFPYLMEYYLCKMVITMVTIMTMMVLKMMVLVMTTTLQCLPFLSD